MAEEKKRDRPAELDAADKTVRQAGGVPTELFFRDDGQIQVSFVVPRAGSEYGPYTYRWDRQECLTLLHNFVRWKIPRVIAIEKKSRGEVNYLASKAKGPEFPS